MIGLRITVDGCPARSPRRGDRPGAARAGEPPRLDGGVDGLGRAASPGCRSAARRATPCSCVATWCPSPTTRPTRRRRVRRHRPHATAPRATARRVDHGHGRRARRPCAASARRPRPRRVAPAHGAGRRERRARALRRRTSRRRGRRGRPGGGLAIRGGLADGVAVRVSVAIGTVVLDARGGSGRPGARHSTRHPASRRSASAGGRRIRSPARSSSDGGPLAPRIPDAAGGTPQLVTVAVAARASCRARTSSCGVEGTRLVATDLQVDERHDRARPPSGSRRMRAGESIVVAPGSSLDLGDDTIIEILPAPEAPLESTRPDSRQPRDADRQRQRPASRHAARRHRGHDRLGRR